MLTAMEETFWSNLQIIHLPSLGKYGRISSKSIIKSNSISPNKQLILKALNTYIIKVKSNKRECEKCFKIARKK